MENQRAVITGLGVVSSIGYNCESFTTSLQLGISGVGYLNNINNSDFNVKIGCEIGDFSLKDYIDQETFPNEIILRLKTIMRRMSLMMETTVASSLQAFKSAGLINSPSPSKRMSVVVAGSNFAQNIQYKIAERYKDSLEYISPNYALQFFDTNFVGTLSEIFGIHGEGYTVGGASASGNSALLHAYRLIKFGVADICLVAGPMADFSPLELQGFRNLGAMGGIHFKDDPKSCCRPFDNEHEGFIFGQGSGCIILESLESAKKRNANILAEMLGGALVLDGNHLSDARKEGEAGAMKKAIDNSSVSKNEIDYINAHGTSTPLGDEVELRAIKTVFGDEISRIWINSTKSMTGHCLHSAGIIETIACIQQMNNGFIHPNLNLNNPIDSSFRFVGKQPVKENINIAMSNSFGFGGINTAVIFRRFYC